MNHALLRSLVVTAALLAGPFAAAQDGAPAEPAAGYDSQALSDEGFVPAVGGADADTIPGGRLMLVAYLIFAGLFGGYGVRLASRHKAVQADLAAVRRKLEDIDDELARRTDA